MPKGVYERSSETLRNIRIANQNKTWSAAGRKRQVEGFKCWAYSPAGQTVLRRPNKHRVDHAGKKFGRWTVVSFYDTLGGESRWLVRCSCGTEKIASCEDITGQRSFSCGCAQKDRANSGASARAHVFCGYKSAAKKRKLAWGLSDEEFDFLTGSNCHYCGTPPSTIKRSRWGTGTFIWNGIDRVDNTLGYISSNVVPCCRICNHAKRTLSYEDFVNWIKKAYDHLTAL